MGSLRHAHARTALPQLWPTAGDLTEPTADKAFDTLLPAILQQCWQASEACHSLSWYTGALKDVAVLLMVGGLLFVPTLTSEPS